MTGRTPEKAVHTKDKQTHPSLQFDNKF